MDGDNGVLGRGIKVLAQVLRHGPCHQIGRCGLDARLRQHYGACLPCGSFILLDHAGNPWDLAGAVEIMCACFGTKLEDGLAVQTVRPNSGDDDKCFLDNSLQLNLVIYIGELDTCTYYQQLVPKLS